MEIRVTNHAEAIQKQSLIVRYHGYGEAPAFAVEIGNRVKKNLSFTSFLHDNS